MKKAAAVGISVAAIAMGGLFSSGQTSEPGSIPTSQLTERGGITVGGRSVAYLIRHLPVSSFPELPAVVADLLTQRGCSIPQTYQAHRPENVVRASLEQSGSSDWAVLCAAEGNVSLLVFFATDPEHPEVLTRAAETQRLQVHDLTGVMGFNWGIDPASPQRVREAQAALVHRPPLLDHDALADTVLEKGTVYRYFSKNRWTTLEMPE